MIQKSTLKTAVLFSVLFAVCYWVINFSGIGVSGLLDITGGANILDFEFGYDAAEALMLLAALGSAGRRFYLTKILPMDFIVPLTYMLFFAAWIALLLKRTFDKKRLSFLLLIPVLAALCDWAENIGVIRMLTGYPEFPAWAASLASVAGMLKTAFTIAGAALTCGLVVVFFVKRRTVI